MTSTNDSEETRPPEPLKPSPLAQQVPQSAEPVTAEASRVESVDSITKVRVFGWNAIFMPVVSLLVFLLTSMLMILIASMLVHGTLDPRTIADPKSIRLVSESRVGFLLLVVTPQVALLVPCLLAAALSPMGFRKRLSLVRGHWPIWAWVAAATSTPLIGWISTVIVGSFMEVSESLEMMSEVFRGHGESGFLIPLALVIGATPAICEEMLFRGYIQTGVKSILGSAIAIVVSSVLFAAFHLDPIHSIGVLPLGIYLGIITWRSGSLLPAMLGHFVNNTISVFAVVIMPAEQGELPSPQAVMFLLSVLGIALFGSAVTAVAMWTLPGPENDAVESSALAISSDAVG